MALEELADAMGERLEDFELALGLLQTFTPRGVGARRLQECLRLQLSELVPGDHVIYHLIDHHLLDLEEGRFSAICQNGDVTDADIAEVLRIAKTSIRGPGRPFANQKNKASAEFGTHAHSAIAVIRNEVGETEGISLR